MISYESLFSLANLYVLPFWGLMILVPRWQWTRRILSSHLPLMVLPILYVVLIVFDWKGVLQLFSTSSPPDVMMIARLLGTPEGATIGWIHLLAFDLFVGRWIYLDGIDQQRGTWLLRVCLFLTLMLGPSGLLLYFLQRPRLA